MLNHKRLFYVIVFLIPLNLGKHFVFNWSYVNGLLTDYLVPTLFITDILLGVLLVLWFVEGLIFKKSLRYFFPYITFFLFAVFLSVLSSVELYASLYAYGRLLLYVGFFFYVVFNFDVSKDLVSLIKVIFLSSFLISLLGIAQWVKQSSVFDNYLFFGEQPYTVSTKGVVRDNFFGVSKVPPYGTFRHPNILGGFLCVTLIWVLWTLLVSTLTKWWRLFGWVAFLVGVFCLFLTLSKISWIVFVLGACGVLLRRFAIRRVFLLVMICCFVLSLTLPFLKVSNISVVRRSDLLASSFAMIDYNPLFGVGLNTNVSLIDGYLVSLGKPKFTQPVHNVFVLIFSESGVFACVFFTMLLGALILSRRIHFLFFISLFQIVLLSLFDHYFYTINQTQLLFWLTLGVGLSTILVNEES